MIVTEVFYAVNCNRCGEQHSDGEHSFWDDEGTAIENAMESEWKEFKNRHYCPNCHDFNEDTEEVTPLPDYPKHIKTLKKFLNSIVVGQVYIKDEEYGFCITLSMWGRTVITDFERDFIEKLLDTKLISISYTIPEKHYQSPKLLIKTN